MGIVVNSRSFTRTMDNKYIVKEKYDRLFKLIRELTDRFEIQINRFVSCEWKHPDELAPGFSFGEFMHSLTMEQKSVLLSIINNTGRVDMSGFEQSTDYVEAAYAAMCNGVLLSVESSEAFSGVYIDYPKKSEADQVGQARNMSSTGHIDIHAKYIPIRKYVKSAKHGDREYKNSDGRDVSVMDLDDTTAQHVLNYAVDVEGKIYGMHNDLIYEFRKTHDCIYHGFRNDKLTADLVRKILSSYENSNC